MLKFNELRVLPGAKTLRLDVEVLPLEYYDDVYIGNIYIDNQDTFLASGPSTSPIYSYTATADEKRVVLNLDYTDLLGAHPANNLFIVYAVATGTPSSDTPCGMDNATTVGLTLDTVSIHNTIMDYVKEIRQAGVIPRGFIDTYLRYKALDSCIETENYEEAVNIYNHFFRDNPKAIATKKSCKCHG